MQNEQNDYRLHEELREKARAIANFKMHLTVFILANVLIWLVGIFFHYVNIAIWYWAVFPTGIWSVIVIFHYLWVFKWNKDRVEKEYKKLLEKMQKESGEKESEITSPAANSENQKQ